MQFFDGAGLSSDFALEDGAEGALSEDATENDVVLCDIEALELLKTIITSRISIYITLRKRNEEEKNKKVRE